ncbi:MAG TPA: DNA cytosine methyltransferase, partial [Anaeromyxobacteraceae bacterium]|nr:DNA cytosine methyltransferase [Anaeromyxobacteraceae bacterium]
MRVGGLFDGVGLLAYGLHLAGLDHAWLCEVDPWRRSILARRWPGVPIFDDVRAVGADSAERVDVIAGGFPCKGASTAGKRNGFEHPETVLWREMARAVRELRPRYVLVENVANILALHDGAVWGEVLGDLAALGYDVTWDCLPAAAVGAPHLRDRVFAIAAHAEDAGRPAAEPAIQQPRVGPIPGAGGVGAPADTVGDGLRLEPEPEPGSSGAAIAPRGPETAA